MNNTDLTKKLPTDNEIYDVTCTYCGHKQKFEFEPGDNDCETMDDIIDYDIEMMCTHCDIPFRIKSGLSEETLRSLGW